MKTVPSISLSFKKKSNGSFILLIDNFFFFFFKAQRITSLPGPESLPRCRILIAVDAFLFFFSQEKICERKKQD